MIKPSSMADLIYFILIESLDAVFDLIDVELQGRCGRETGD